MKYGAELYVDSGIYSDADSEITNRKEKIVRCRKTHKCAACNSEIQIKELALRETGFMDGEPASCYTCLTCIEEWLEESGQVESEESEDEKI